MLPPPHRPGPRSSRQQRLALAAALVIFSWIQITSAAAEQQPGQQEHPHPGSLQHNPHLRAPHGSGPILDEAVVPPFGATGADNVDSPQGTPYVVNRKRSQSFEKHPQHAHDYHDTDTESDRSNDAPRRRDQHKQNTIIPSDASALATLAPAQAVRAPHSPRYHRPTSSAASGLASPQVARSLRDWEVEDFVLLATVDGDLYASDRKTGTERWRLEVDQPMIETTHHRSNSSILDDDYSSIDHYIWAVEPNRDGGLYVWSPDSGTGLVRTGFTMKRLVEELAPFADTSPAVVYTGDKKTTLITVDAATGRVLKWFGSSGSHINEAESCLRPSTLYKMDSNECSSTGTITLGRTEYTVGIQRRDGRPIATLKYAEWGPNNYDNDLYHQHHSSLDGRYISSQPDGKVYAFDYKDARKSSPKFTQRFSAPVARVFDVCRPWDAPSGSNPELVVLPQPPMPSHDEEIASIRSNSIFLNRTELGSWYAMSGRAYPLIIDAPMAQVSDSDWVAPQSSFENIHSGDFYKALVGTHYLEPRKSGGKQPATLPAGPIHDSYEDSDNDSYLPVLVPDDAYDVGIIDKVKTLPHSAANSFIDFVSNPTLILVFLIALLYNENKLRRAYQRFRAGKLQWHPFIASQELSSINDLDNDSQNDESSTSAIGKAQEPLPDVQVQEAVVKENGEKTSSNPDIPEEKQSQVVGTEAKTAEVDANGTPPEKKKKAHRGRRGGVKHRKGKVREPSQSQGDESTTKPQGNGAIDIVMNFAGEEQKPSGLEPDIKTVSTDVQAVSDSFLRMGNIEVNTDKQLGSGSNGTLVFAGKFDGRDVAVKRMLIHFYDIASQETKLLRESDDHPNVIRYYAQQTQEGFLYIALELCAASLAEIIEKPHAYRNLADAGREDVPSVLYQITNGISHLHSLRIVHRDLKPQNILVNMGKNGKPRMLVSDFGLCKKLEDTQSSFGATTGRAAGTTGWRAPELLLDDDTNGSREAALMEPDTNSGSGSVLVRDGTEPNSHRATRAIDIFSLGLVFFYVLTSGQHPFDCGDRYMREVNIRNGNFSLDPLDVLGEFAYEAKDLIASMLRRDPKHRPTAAEIMSHPFFWSAKKRLAFLCDVSDHFEKECRDPPSPALEELERHANQVTRGDFLRALPREFVDSLGKQRKYTGSKLLDLLRALRNKRNHYEDMSDSLKRLVGPLPGGYLGFWSLKFPNLLLVCWNVVYEVRWEQTDRFKEYYEPAGL